MAIPIAILAGGNSSEFQISMNSAHQVYQNLDKKLFTPWLIVISGTEWYLIPEESSENKIPVDKNDFTVTMGNQKISFGAVFIAIHGTPGEDGKIQSYFEMLDIPFTSCNSFVSALTFNKYACKKYLESFGILSAQSVLSRKAIDSDELHRRGISFPVFVKANSSGSSYGVTRVTGPDTLKEAFGKAFRESSEAIVEEEIKGTEVTCGVFSSKGEKIIFPPTEIVSHKEYFDLEAKYTPGMADEITPARLPEEKLTLIRNTASDIYDLLGCTGVVRIDFILKDDLLYFLEINTVPGLSRESIIPKQAETYGLSLKELFTLVLQDTLNRKS